MRITQQADIESFISRAASELIIDVRSPAEFEYAHIPGAVNLPIFDNEERAQIGTLYKHSGREEAIKIGLEIWGPKMRSAVEFVEDHLADSRKVFVHCWRGGMRSGAMAWLLDLYGFEVFVLRGGYKSFRNFALKSFEHPYTLKILGGFTGSGKTEILRSLSDKGMPVIDMESLANHKGSSFGRIGQQPTQEMFENRLAMQLFLNRNKEIWLEDESQRIGDRLIPNALWDRMRRSDVHFIQVPFDIRLFNIVRDFGSLDRDYIKRGILAIQKRLGPLDTKIALAHLDDGDMFECFRLLLNYYDKQYRKSLIKRPEDFQLFVLETPDANAQKNADLLLREIKCRKILN